MQEAGGYWQIDVATTGKASAVGGEMRPIRLKFHAQQEKSWGCDEIIPLVYKPGQPVSRIGLHIQPYIKLPDHPGHDVYPHTIGEVRARFYTQPQILVLWECGFFAPFREEDPCKDKALAILWASVERQCLRLLPGTRQIATKPWSAGYQHSSWQDFLKRQDYLPSDKQAFVKQTGKGTK